MDLLKHSVEINGVTPPKYNRDGNKEKTCGITVNGEYLPFDYDDEKLYFNIEKPTLEEINNEVYKLFKLNSRDPEQVSINPNKTKRNNKQFQWEEIPILEWKKRLELPPDDIVQQTMAATTQHYLEVEAERQYDPRRHFAK